jgi:hypothetical protein
MSTDPRALESRPEMRFVHPLTYAQWMRNNHYYRTRELLPRRRRVVDFNPTLVRAFVAAGIPFLTGTDSGIPGVVGGFALHDEFDALARAGISPFAILEASTRRPAEWLGVAEDRGTIQVGRRADMVLLTADPLVDIANARRIAAVVRDGRLLPRAELDRQMEALAARYAAMRTPAPPRTTSDAGLSAPAARTFAEPGARDAGRARPETD